MFDELEELISDMLNQFENDPADTPYQEGYLACLEEVKKMMDRMKNVTFSLTT